MTFEEWWKTADDDDLFGSGDAKLFARDAWNAALEEAARACGAFSGRAIMLTADVPDAFIMCANAVRRIKSE